MLDPELMEQFQLLFGAIEQTNGRIDQTNTEMRAMETRINVNIENNVTKRIEALFDGYRLTHEKQWEMEREAERMKQELDLLKVRMDVLESKVSS